MSHARFVSLCAVMLICLLHLPSLAVAQETAAASDMLNANLATAAELKAALEDEALAENIVENRPYLSLMELGAVLMETLDADQIETALRKISVPINLNTASREEILLIPGVGPRMAHEFEEYRPYVAMAQFRREIGKYVDDDEVERLATYVFVPVNLNEATDEAILAIPGVGNRMLHEFKEYRPYVNIEQFRREIGKYVDDQELARLERFVTL